MKQEESLRKLQMIELDILKDIDKICKDNNLTYYLGEGTLLGAVRHKGFIPWDDDVDILMPREDYDKFLKLDLSDDYPQYEIQHSSRISGYFSPILKFRLKDKSFYQQSHIAHVTENNGPLVDIFPLDNVPEKASFSQKMQSRKIRILRGMMTIKMGLGKADNIQRKIIKLFTPFFSVNRLHTMLERNFKKYNNPENEYYVSLGSYYPVTRQTFPKSWYGKPECMEFEGFMFPVPQKSHQILTSVYGDYMELPPENERVVKHHF